MIDFAVFFHERLAQVVCSAIVFQPIEVDVEVANFGFLPYKVNFIGNALANRSILII